MDLLTGATGFLGNHLAARLARDGRKLRAIVRPGTDLRRIPREISEVVWGEIGEPETLQGALAGVDVVFHTAARVSGGGGRDAFARDNIAAVEALLRAAEAAGVRRFVHVSSAGIFGAGQKGVAITEDTPLDPAIEHRGVVRVVEGRVGSPGARVRRSSRGSRPSSCGRASSTAATRSRSSRACSSRCRAARAGGSIVGSRSALLPLTHVDNACDAIALAAERGRSGAAYNVIDGTGHARGSISICWRAHGVRNVRPTFVPPFMLWPVALAVEVLGKLARRDLPLTRYRLKRATESLSYDTSAARDGLGWTPSVDLPTGVRAMADAAAGPTVR